MKTPDQVIDFEDWLAGRDDELLERAAAEKARQHREQLARIAAMGGAVAS